MKFSLIDNITELVPGERATAVKALTLAEEYLGDHFPRFPVLPGVLMLEGMVQTASWLVRKTEDFAHSMIQLSEARNVTYKSFLAPGQTMTIQVTAKSIDADMSKFVGSARRGDTEIVKAHLTLRHFNLADRDEKLAANDERVISWARSQLDLLTANA
jgi:3-hydroxyacyl-[acyl-carrier-protein] dehydratase